MPLIAQIAIFVLVLSFLVIIHELGHLLAAKWAKVKVEEFGVGYPPRAFKLFTWGKVIFSMNWIPVGGFVRMFGEDGPNSEDDGKSEHESEDEDGLAPFYKRSRKKRMVIILAGVVVNFIFGILAFAFIFSNQGIPTRIDTARVGFIASDSPAEQAGIEVGTEIRQVVINPGQENQETIQVENTSHVIQVINDHLGEEVKVVTSGVCDGFECDDSYQEYTLTLRAEDDIPDNQGSMGVGFNEYVPKFYSWYEMPLRSVWFGIQQALMLSIMILFALVDVFMNLFQGTVPQDVAGPVGIVDQAASSGIFEQGFLSILNFSALISINLAVVNLLPIPALDGGRAVFIILEKFIGKRKVQKVEGYANYGGMAVLLFLILLITITDIGRIVTR